VLKIVLLIVLALAGVVLGAIFALRFLDPPGSMLMAIRAREGVAIRQEWTPITAIAPAVIRAVVVHEDPRICAHWGVDWPRIRGAVKTAGDGAPEDTSTIAMQTVKNLVLWPERSYLRKALEIPLAYAMTLVLPRRRIVELYLNVAEWAPGVFGIGAAARHHFAKAPADLTPREAALLAAALPNPHVHHAGRPGPRTRALAGRIGELARENASAADCILSLRAGPEVLAKPAEYRYTTPQHDRAGERPRARRLQENDHGRPQT